jgi:hypothetical protein
MKIEIQGNPGTGNSYTEIHIGTVQNYNPNATTVINNYYGKHTRQDTGTQNGDMEDKDELRTKILQYVKRTEELTSESWKNKYMTLWGQILKIKQVDAEVYDAGGQQGTSFNRVLVAAIMRVLLDNAVYHPKCTATALAIALEGNKDHHVRQEIGKYPSADIQRAVKTLLE